MELIQQELNKIFELKSISKSLNRKIGGITVKDIIVRWYKDINKNIKNFSFYVKKDNKLFAFYYDWKDKNIFNFIPPGFVELYKNYYEFNGTFKQAINKLKKYGITDIKESEYY